MKPWVELTPQEQRQRRDAFGVKTTTRILTFLAAPMLAVFGAWRDFRDWRDPTKETRFVHIFTTPAVNLYEAWRWSITGRGELWGEEW